MPARGPIPNRPERRLTPPARTRTAVTVALVLIAAVIGWLIRGPSTKTVTRTVQQPPATINQDTPAGAVAAVQVFFAKTERQQSPPPAPVNRPGKLASEWQLGWRMKSFTTSKAVVETWGVALQGGFGKSGQTWLFNDVPVFWQGGRWVAGSPPTSWSAGRRLTTVISRGATPPADNTPGPADTAFGQLLWSLKRFPGAP